MKRPSLSLCLIAKNEEENIDRFFDSIEGCFDQVVLVDTGSTDKTVEKATARGAEIQHFEWINDFAAARNYAFSFAQCDYVAWLDLDDSLSNREGFLRFRDDIMGLADYWMARYDYSSDAQGKPVCSFARERVFKRDKGFTWRYPIHEGVVPDSATGPVRIDFASSWHVTHMRTAADLEKDRSRNLNIFSEMDKKGGMDARMRYYYGKELFETGSPAESVGVLVGALKDPSLEMHDRIVATQYLCYAFVQCGQFAKAIEQAYNGLMLAPHRAEFHTVIGDCHLKLGNPGNAIPSYAAAKASTIIVPPFGVGAIFHSEDAYTVWPRNQLARIYANIGDLESAARESLEAVTKYPNAESQAIYDKVIEMKREHDGYKNAVECHDIVISCPPTGPYEWDEQIAKERAMGGSETAAIEMSRWLHTLTGRRVLIFNMRTESKSFDGVEYRPASQLAGYMAKNRPWMHIAWRHNFKVTDAPTFAWVHDLLLQGGENHQNYEKMLCLTPFHKRFVMVKQGVPDHKIHVTRNGLNPEKFAGAPVEKDPFRFVFGSSPDRGLDRAMRVLDKVRETHPEVTLHVHYGIEHLHKYGMQDLANRLKAMMDERPWVKYHGATQQNDLMKSYKESAYCVQPSDFIETSMISAMELVCCGVYPIMREIGGAADTLRPFAEQGMATLVDSDCVTEREYAKYVEATLEAIRTEAYKRVKADPELLSWKSVAQSWVEELPKLMERECFAV